MRGYKKASKIFDGYIHFKVGDTDHVHHLHESSKLFDVSDLSNYVEMGREEEGMKKFILTNYVFLNKKNKALTKDEIEIVSHHFEFETE